MTKFVNDTNIAGFSQIQVSIIKVVSAVVINATLI